MNEDRVVELLTEIRDLQRTHLERYQEALDDFFRILTQFTHLEELVFSEISLEEMDLSGLGHLGRLRTLIWRGHGEPRKEFPPAICKLANLERLEIFRLGIHINQVRSKLLHLPKEPTVDQAVRA